MEHPENETMNTLVSSYAPKTKHYSGNNSMITRIGIIGVCQVVGNTKFWSKVCSAMHFNIDPHLLSVLSKRDEKKERKQVVAGTLDGKRKRAKANHGKINKEHKTYMDSKEEYLLYKSGIAVAAARKTLPDTKDRNPEGIPTHLLRCIYYHASNPEVCNAFGCQDCKNAVCQMESKRKE